MHVNSAMLEAIAMVTDESKRARVVEGMESIRNSGRGTIVDVIKVGYASGREEIDSPVFRFFENFPVHVVQQGHLDRPVAEDVANWLSWTTLWTPYHKR